MCYLKIIFDDFQICCMEEVINPSDVCALWWRKVLRLLPITTSHVVGEISEAKTVLTIKLRVLHVFHQKGNKILEMYIISLRHLN